jgi:hypothetical protein
MKRKALFQCFPEAKKEDALLILLYTIFPVKETFEEILPFLGSKKGTR